MFENSTRKYTETLATVEAQVQRIDDCRDQLHALKLERDQLIKSSLEIGISAVDLAKATGVSTRRVYQIKNEGAIRFW